MPFEHIVLEKRPNIYLVGGAVRDKWLGRPIVERDWVVVGATPEDMLYSGFRPVGKDFPVFLDPQTQEEYALARTERKIGAGYTGFACHTDPSISLEEDLKRRDLTINAMAEDPTGRLIDPYHGFEDLRRGVLRHVSDAFSEDPLRVLRVARFAAMLPHFHIHPMTRQYMLDIVKRGDLASLVAERVVIELNKTLCYLDCDRFFKTLSDCNALAHLFPGLIINDTLEKSLKRLSQYAAHLSIKEQIRLRFVLVFHTLSNQNRQRLYHHYPIPKHTKQLTELMAQYKCELAQLPGLSSNKQLDLLYAVDAIRRPHRFDLLAIAIQSLEERAEHCKAPLLYEYTHRLSEAVRSIAKKRLLQQKLCGDAWKEALRHLQLQAIVQWHEKL